MTPILNYIPVALPALGESEPSGLPIPGLLLYWPSINALTSGDPIPPNEISLVALDAQNISILPTDTVIEVVIYNRGASQWKRVFFEPGFSTNLETDVVAGVIVPLNFDAITNPYYLIRVAGW